MRRLVALNLFRKRGMLEAFTNVEEVGDNAEGTMNGMAGRT